MPLKPGMAPFRVEVREADLDDLRLRLRRTRWPDAETVGDRSQGVPLQYVQQLRQYWADAYDWRATEARFNAWPQLLAEIGGLGIHVLHAESPHAGALPLVLTHGWPGSWPDEPFLRIVGPSCNADDPFARPGGMSGVPDRADGGDAAPLEGTDESVGNPVRRPTNLSPGFFVLRQRVARRQPLASMCRRRCGCLLADRSRRDVNHDRCVIGTIPPGIFRSDDYLIDWPVPRSDS